MEFEKIKKYFKPQSKLFLIGIPIMLVGIFIMIAMNYTMRMVGGVILVAGVIVMFALMTSGMKDQDIDAAVDTKMNTIEADASVIFKFPRRYEVLHKAVILGDYDFTGDVIEPVKRGKDLRYRNTRYCGLLMNFTNDGLRILSRKFSIVEDVCDEENLHFTWEEIDNAKLDEHAVSFKMVNDADASYKCDVFRLTLKNGKVYSYAVKNTADVDEAIDCIYRQTVRVKQQELKDKTEEA